MAKLDSLMRILGKNSLLAAFAAFLILFVFLSVILCFQISTNIKLSKSFASLKEFIETQNEVLYNQILSSSNLIENLVIDRTEKITADIDTTNKHLNRVEKIYGSLLDEQKKKTLVDLYDEPFVIDRYKNAEKLFNERKYRQAYDEFSFVSNEQPENLDALFFKYYSLFMINKGDQSQYRVIKNSFLQLQKRGYARSEIRDVLDFISNEENPPARPDQKDIQ